MATVTITITDLDLVAEDFNVDFLATGNEIDNGQATAAYFTGYFMYGLVNTPEFTAGVAAFGRELCDRLNKQGVVDLPKMKSTVVLTMEDVDLNTGQFKPTLEIHSGEPHGERLPSIAEIVGVHMRNLLNKPEFVAQVWDYAKEYSRTHDNCVVANLDHAADKAA